MVGHRSVKCTVLEERHYGVILSDIDVVHTLLVRFDFILTDVCPFLCLAVSSVGFVVSPNQN